MFPRFADDWEHPPVSLSDPLGIVRCSHHTVLTKDLTRSLRCAVDVLGGRVFHREPNPLLGTDSSYVYLADTVIEYALVDGANSPLQREWDPAPANLLGQPQQDIYHAISFLVEDLDRAVRHLAAENVGFEHRSPYAVLTDPADCLGMRWGFTSRLAAGDPRTATAN